ncbi:AraC family transcriptional regulator [Flavobacterium sp. NKUCC04_CG]|uniref:helix-turn-helix domain-containing protein n=1 Tax=Flavobacterium sp. NKUCC04_CG TaxID=2842121 RepID=UPI001C5BE446|nr:AraC family transcriptional regulator [Flavobacterium sp. NKUCC04_CG]MBW3520367.1 AraC family transcriptional regulator [Flavobacterium sp. NKUCC04_CG]
MDNFYLIILSNVILMSLVNIYFNSVIYRGQIFYTVQLLFLCFIIIHSIYICITKLFFATFYFIDVGAPFGLFYGPFFYIGLSFLINDESKVLKREWTHFALGLLFIPIFLVLTFFFRYNLTVLKVYSIILYGLICLQMVVYTLVAYIRFNRMVKDKKAIAIMSQSIIVMLATALIFLGIVFSDLNKQPNAINSFVIYALMLSAVVIMFRYNLLILVRKFTYYKNSYTGKLFFDYFKEQFIAPQEGQIEQVPQPVVEVEPPLEIEVVKYQKSRISEEEMNNYLKSLDRAWEAKIYLNPDLTLNLLSKTAHIPKYHLTQVFNLGLNSNFNKFINALRVQHAVCLLDNPNNMETIEEIMMQSGFNSRSSFYRAFNVYYDISPADYRKQANL